MTLRV